MALQSTAGTRLRTALTPRKAAQLVALAAAYFILARVGLTFDHGSYDSPLARTIWPASGLALAALLMGGLQLWPAIGLGSVIAQVSVGTSIAIAFGIAVSHVLEAMAGARLVRRFGGARDAAIHTVRGACVLVAAGAFGTTTLSASIGTLTLALAGKTPSSGPFVLWCEWWAGHILGVLLLAPLLLALPLMGREPWREVRRLEAAMAMLAMSVVSVLVFASKPLGGMAVHTYFVFPPLLWAALRLRQPGAALATFLMSMIAAVATRRGLGPFASPDLARGALSMQAFLAIVALTGLILAAVSAERRRAGEQLILADRLAAMGTLAAGIAHEINNPLAYLIMCLEMISKIVHRSREQLTNAVQLEELLSVAREGADKMRRIVSDMRTLGRNDEDVRGPIDVQRVLESSLELAWPEIQPRAKLVKDFGPIPHVDASPGRLGQVFLNLLINAAQSIPTGQVELNTVRVGTRVDSRGRVEISVADSGSGIEAHHRVHLFEPFYTTKSVPEGVGLGLSVCHALVQSFNGTIEVESELGRGSIFRVLLPPSRSAPAVETSRPSRRPEARLSILIVEDEAHLAESLALLLEDHDVRVALGGREALDATASRNFDLILCDLLMPVVTGMDVFEELRRRGSGQERKIVFMTGGAFTLAAQQFMASIPNRTLEKPFATETLLQLVEQTGHDVVAARSAE